MCEPDIAPIDSEAYAQSRSEALSMRLHRFTHFGSAALTFGCLAALTAGCEGGQTGDLSGGHPDGNETGSLGGCEEHKQKLAGFDTQTDAGTAEEMLAYAEKSFDAPITWKTARQGQSWAVGPESGQGVIHVDVARGASAYALTYTAKPNNSGLDIGVICPPSQLGVEAHITVTTDGGALAESFDTLLRTSAPGVATFSVPLDLQKVSGELSVTSTNPHAKLVQAGLDATLIDAGMTGSIGGLEQVEGGEVASASAAVLAIWPDSEACAGGEGIGLPVETAVLGVTGTETLSSVATSTPAPITWKDGSQTTIEVGIDSLGDGCFAVSKLPLELDGGPGVTYPVTIALHSADGRLDGQYAGQVVVSGSGSQRRVVASANLMLDVEDVAKSGFKSVSVPDGSDGVGLQIDSHLSGGEASGSVRLFAIVNPPCLTNPEPPMSTPGGGMSVPGCAGQTQTQLETASWGG